MIISALIGTGHFASGHLVGLSWLRGVGVAWWMVSAVLAWVSGSASLLLLASAVVVLEMGPALVLRRRDTAIQPVR